MAERGQPASQSPGPQRRSGLSAAGSNGASPPTPISPSTHAPSRNTRLSSQDSRLSGASASPPPRTSRLPTQRQNGGSPSLASAPSPYALPLPTGPRGAARPPPFNAAEVVESLKKQNEELSSAVLEMKRLMDQRHDEAKKQLAERDKLLTQLNASLHDHRVSIDSHKASIDTLKASIPSTDELNRLINTRTSDARSALEAEGRKLAADNKNWKAQVQRSLETQNSRASSLPAAIPGAAIDAAVRRVLEVAGAEAHRIADSIFEQKIKELEEAFMANSVSGPPLPGPMFPNNMSATASPQHSHHSISPDPHGAHRHPHVDPSRAAPSQVDPNGLASNFYVGEVRRELEVKFSRYLDSLKVYVDTQIAKHVRQQQDGRPWPSSTEAPAVQGDQKKRRRLEDEAIPIVPTVDPKVLEGIKSDIQSRLRREIRLDVNGALKHDIAEEVSRVVKHEVPVEVARAFDARPTPPPPPPSVSFRTFRDLEGRVDSLESRRQSDSRLNETTRDSFDSLRRQVDERLSDADIRALVETRLEKAAAKSLIEAVVEDEVAFRETAAPQPEVDVKAILSLINDQLEQRDYDSQLESLTEELKMRGIEVETVPQRMRDEFEPALKEVGDAFDDALAITSAKVDTVERDLADLLQNHLQLKQNCTSTQENVEKISGALRGFAPALQGFVPALSNLVAITERLPPTPASE